MNITTEEITIIEKVATKYNFRSTHEYKEDLKGELSLYFFEHYEKISERRGNEYHLGRLFNELKYYAIKLNEKEDMRLNGWTTVHDGTWSTAEIISLLSQMGSGYVGDSESLAELEGAFYGLTANVQQVLRLSFIEGKRIKQVAAELGKSEPAIEQARFRGLTKLKQKLNGLRDEARPTLLI